MLCRPKKPGDIRLPEVVKRRLARANTPEEISEILSQEEARIARFQKGASAEFLDCDEVANILSQELKKRCLPHVSMLGESDEGSSHVWVEVRGKRLDPTKQGFGKKRPVELDAFKGC